MPETRHNSSTGQEIDGAMTCKIRLKLVDLESGESRICTLAELETWDGANPEIWRTIGGWQITSFQGLLDLLNLKMEKGYEEIEILEAPRFMMLSGG